MPFYLNGVGVEDEFLAGMPLYRGHEVAGQPRHTLLPPVGVATCILGNSWRGARVYIFGGALECIFLGHEDFSPSVS